MPSYFLVKFFAVGLGLLCGMLLALEVDRLLGGFGLVALSSLLLLLVSVMGVI